MTKSRIQHPLLLLLAFQLLATAAFAQDGNSGDVIDKIISFPDKIFNRIDKEANKAEQRITSSTEKYLNKLEKQELKLKRKLWKTDSIKAKEVFGDVKGRYDALRNSLANKEAAIEQQSNTYIGHIDSLNTAMKFLQTNFTGAIPSSFGGVGGGLQSFTNLQNSFTQTELIRKQIQQRQQYLKSQLQNTGLVKEFRKYRQYVYTYQLQAREYKEALSDPDKFGKKLLETAMKFPAFQNFFREHSELASLFALPGGPLPTSPGGGGVSPGLQTRADVQQQLMNQFGVQTFTAPAGGGASPFQQQVQAAQAELQKIKDKAGQPGTVFGGEEDADLDFVPDQTKTKSFKQRLVYSTNIQSNRGRGIFVNSADIGLSIGFKLNDKSVFGFGGSYKAGLGTGFNNMRLSHEGVSYRSYLDYKPSLAFLGKIGSNLWISGGYERNHFAAFNRIEALRDKSSWKNSFLLGASKVIDVKSKFFKKTKLSVLYDFNWRTPGNVQTQPVVFRINYQF